MKEYMILLKTQLKKFKYYYSHDLINAEQYQKLCLKAKSGSPDLAEKKLQMIMGRRFVKFEDDM